MKRFLLLSLVAALVSAAAPATAHDRDLVTAGGRVGPIRTGGTTNADMRELFGRPSQRKVVRVGCSRVVRLTWRGEIQTLAYRADAERRVVDVKILARTVAASGSASSYRFHTRKGLRVGDSERRLRNLYPNRRDGHRHRGHTHYLLAESDRGTRLIAKVVDHRVVELEAAPYEFC